jgi:hypothetical protein
MFGSGGWRVGYRPAQGHHEAQGANGGCDHCRSGKLPDACGLPDPGDQSHAGLRGRPTNCDQRKEGAQQLKGSQHPIRNPPMRNRVGNRLRLRNE